MSSRFVRRLREQQQQNDKPVIEDNEEEEEETSGDLIRSKKGYAFSLLTSIHHDDDSEQEDETEDDSDENSNNKGNEKGQERGDLNLNDYDHMLISSSPLETTTEILLESNYSEKSSYEPE